MKYLINVLAVIALFLGLPVILVISESVFLSNTTEWLFDVARLTGLLSLMTMLLTLLFIVISKIKAGAR